MESDSTHPEATLLGNGVCQTRLPMWPCLPPPPSLASATSLGLVGVGAYTLPTEEGRADHFSPLPLAAHWELWPQFRASSGPDGPVDSAGGPPLHIH